MNVLKSLFNKVHGLTERNLPFFSCLFFISGIGISSYSFEAGAGVASFISGIINYYSYVAPVAIYLILAPALIKIYSAADGKGGKFVPYAIRWLAIRKLMACFWGVIFTSIVFRLPMFDVSSSPNVINAIFGTARSLGHMLINSTYFYAVYASIITLFVARQIKWVANTLHKISDGIESAGPFFIPFIPLFMLAIGAYIYELPATIGSTMGFEKGAYSLHGIQILGFPFISAHNPAGLILIYVIGALLTGIANMMWHSALLVIAKFQVPTFKIRSYFSNYWIKVYPLLWSTSSESLAAPLNLHLVQKYYPEVKMEVRRLIVGMGSFLNINGTIICVFVMMGLVASVVGYPLTVFQLLISILLVFIISYGVPGIPGELVLFAGPIVTLLNMPSDMAKVFLLLYIGLQVGLPDSFRSGDNSTDNCVLSIILNKIYEKKFLKKGVS